MIGPSPIGDGRSEEADDADRRITTVTFEERERNQRFLRLLMMLLMLLILMDGEQEPNRRSQQFHESVPYLRSGIKSVFLRGKLDGLWSPLSTDLFERRRVLDRRIHLLQPITHDRLN